MLTENLPSLIIHKLTQEQYDKALIDGKIDDNAIYLTPDEKDAYTIEEIDALLETKAGKSHRQSSTTITTTQLPYSTDWFDDADTLDESILVIESKLSELSDRNYDDKYADLKHDHDDKYAAQEDFDSAVEEVHKTIDEINTTIKNNVSKEYVDKKAEETLAAAQNSSSQTAANVSLAFDNYKAENDTKVNENIKDINALQTGLDAEIARIDAIIGDYLQEEDKKDLQDNIDTKVGSADYNLKIATIDGNIQSINDRLNNLTTSNINMSNMPWEGQGLGQDLDEALLNIESALINQIQVNSDINDAIDGFEDTYIKQDNIKDIIPVSLSELENDTGFVTSNDLEDMSDSFSQVLIEMYGEDYSVVEEQNRIVTIREIAIDVSSDVQTNLDNLSEGIAYINPASNEIITDVNIETNNVTIDSSLSLSSTNPVQNRVVTAKLQEMSNTIDSIADSNQELSKITPQMYREEGDADDTPAFKKALAANRIVYVPEGNYTLSDTLIIGENSELELAQSAVLNFAQINKPCITLLRLASLKGNHATIQVPYEFSSSVINSSTEDDLNNISDTDGDGNKENENTIAVPPFTKWSPQWKMSRYVTDINICKTMGDTYKGVYAGFHYSKTGDTAGKAINMVCREADYPIKYMWGVSMSGVRIAGAFEYGIYIDNIYTTNKDEAWNHDMRIEAVMDGCKVGVYAHNCNIAHFDVTFQPRNANNNTAYAEKGVELHDCKWIDLSRAFIWDWNENRTLCNKSVENRPIAMYGECEGLVLSIPYYYDGITDVATYIYSDNENNLEYMTLLQKPSGSKEFKSIDGKPYFLTKTTEKELATQEDFKSLFGTTMKAKFINQLPIATDKNGNRYNGIGYKLEAMCIDSEDSGEKYEKYSILTGYIPVKDGSVVYFKGLKWTQNNGYYERVYFFDTNKNPLNDGTYNAFITAEHMNNGDNGKLYYKDYQTSDDGFSFALGENNLLNNVGFIRVNFFKNDIIDANPIISVDDEIIYEQVGTLVDGIKVKAENVILESPNGTLYKIVVSDDGTLSTIAQ